MKRAILYLIFAASAQSAHAAWFSDLCTWVLQSHAPEVQAPSLINTASSASVRAGPSWVANMSLLSTVPGVRLQGIRLHGRPDFQIPGTKPGTVFLSENFFVESGLPQPNSVHSSPMHTYRYYPTEATGIRSGRGSGRDHLVALNADLLEDRTLAVKGSGTNTKFSAVNASAFALSDFRRNGLQTLNEAATEYTVAKIFETNGVPMTPYEEISLLPAELQLQAMHQGNPNKLAAQTVRRHLQARESTISGPTSYDAAMKLAARLYFLNIGHGAINPENITADGLLDLGHVTVGNPLVSGAYRCTLCQGVEGSSYDRTMVGILDHYFKLEAIPDDEEILAEMKGFNDRIRARSIADQPGFLRPHVHRAYTFRYVMNNEDYSILYTEILRILNPSLPSLHLNSKEAQAFKWLLTEELGFKEFNSANRGIGNLVPLFEAQDRLLGINQEVWATAGADREIAKDLAYRRLPEKTSVSMRLILQLSALKRFLPEAQNASLRKVFYASLMPGARSAVQTLLTLTDELLTSKSVADSTLRSLFDFYLPVHEIEKRFSLALNARVQTDQELKLNKIAATVHDEVERLSQPHRVSPEQFANELQKLLKEAD